MTSRETADVEEGGSISPHLISEANASWRTLSLSPVRLFLALFLFRALGLSMIAVPPSGYRASMKVWPV